MPELKNLVEVKYPESRIFHNEFIRGADGKFRYFVDLRLKLYREIYRSVQDFSPDIPLYFCMESEEVWQDILGWSPSSDRELREILCRWFQ
jgi:spore photoproduct lyase